MNQNTTFFKADDIYYDAICAVRYSVQEAQLPKHLGVFARYRICNTHLELILHADPDSIRTYW